MSGRNSKLRLALDKEKGRNIRLEKQRKHEKEVAKKKRPKQRDVDEAPLMTGALTNGKNIAKVRGVDQAELQALLKGGGEDSSDWEDEDLEQNDDEDLSEDELEEFDEEGAAVLASRSSSGVNGVSAAEAAATASLSDEEDQDQDETDEEEQGENANEEEEEGNDVPLSDLSEVSDSEDIRPHQKLTKNNIPALQRALKSIQLPLSTLPFSLHQSITCAQPTQIDDVNDDLQREQALYAQSYEAVKRGRALLLAEGAPFTRPNDYFAEMVKTDEHMGKVKDKLVESAAARKASEEAKRQRQQKKYGKQVQQERLKERAQAKREMLDKVSALKRKRKDTGGIGGEGQREEDLFDVQLDESTENGRKAKRPRLGKDGKPLPGKKREMKNQRFGFGGKKRFAKSNTAESTGDTRGYSAKKMKGSRPGKQRPGKSRRQKQH